MRRVDKLTRRLGKEDENEQHYCDESPLSVDGRLIVERGVQGQFSKGETGGVKEGNGGNSRATRSALGYFSMERSTLHLRRNKLANHEPETVYRREKR